MSGARGKTILGVIGGSGVYDVSGIEKIKRHDVDTPFGKPSDQVFEARVGDNSVFFIPRHGRGHVLTPSEVNYRANIFALKTFGVTHLLSVSAVGIMKEHIKPGEIIIPDQLFDRTKGSRESTFFGEGVVGHVQFADPFCKEFSQHIQKSALKKTGRVHFGGTLVVMEGPQFSTRAESLFYRRTLEPVAIGMTALPEAKLAREAEMSYGLLALATDYDCWYEEEDDVSVDAVMQVLKNNSNLAGEIVKQVAESIPESFCCSCHTAAKFAVMTARDKISAGTLQKLAPLFGHYFA